MEPGDDFDDFDDCDASVAEGRRMAALEKAIETAKDSHANADQIVKDARIFETYLKGDDNA